MTFELDTSQGGRETGVKQVARLLACIVCVLLLLPLWPKKSAVNLINPTLLLTLEEVGAMHWVTGFNKAYYALI